MHYVYIIYSEKLDKTYTGSTGDLRARFEQHKRGRSRYTKQVQDWVLVYYEAFINKTDSLREERFLKTGKGKERIEILLKHTLTEKLGGVA